MTSLMVNVKKFKSYSVQSLREYTILLEGQSMEQRQGA